MKNVITISGDPGSGKSTVRNALKQKFEEQGKTVIVYSVGDIFRHLKCFKEELVAPPFTPV